MQREILLSWRLCLWPTRARRAPLAGLAACIMMFAAGACAPAATGHEQPAGELSAGGQSMAYPAGVNPRLLQRLCTELRRVLAEQQAKGMRAQFAPTLTPQRADDGADAVLTWEYNLGGDYNQDGLVSINDLTPIGAHFGAQSGAADWPVARPADGNADGMVTINDITPIGQNWQGFLAEYIIEAANAAGGPWDEVGRTAHADGLAPSGGGFLQYSFRAVGGATRGFFRVHGDDGVIAGQGDKWELWSGGVKLRGANLWQAPIDPAIYGDSYGEGPYGPPVTQADLDGLAAIGANYVNISHPGLYTVLPPYVLDPAAQANLDQLLAMAEAADLFAVITFRTGPGRSEFTFNRSDVGTWFQPSDLIETVWTDPAAQAAWAEMWRHTAARYKDNPVVAAYDLMCEPNSPDVMYGLWEPSDYYPAHAGEVHDWNMIYPPIVNAIREVDTLTPVIVAATDWSLPRWLPSLSPSSADRVVYAVHQYEPHDYTHRPDTYLSVTYPGLLDLNWDGTPDTFDQSALSAFLDPLREFVSLYDAPVCSNEFGAMRFEPGAAQFVADQTELFEQLKMNNAIWAWTPAFVSGNPAVTWDEFNFRHGPDPANHADVSSSELQSVLRNYWLRNTVRPSSFTSPPPVTTRLQQLHAARHFMYQIQGIDAPGAVDALAATHYDLLVVEPTATVQGSEDFDVAAMVAQLKASADSQGGHKLVLAYINIGQAEDYRTYWAPSWIAPTTGGPGTPDFLLTTDPDGWPGNYPVAFWDVRWQAMVVDNADSLLRQALTAGFDGIYMDWVDGYNYAAVTAAAASAGVDPAQAMADFIAHLRDVARQTDPEFLVIQQNAPYLIDAAPAIAGVIDAVGMEDIWFYGNSDATWGDPQGGDIPQDTVGDYSTAALIAQMQQYSAAGKAVLTIDYCLNATNAAQVYTDSQALGFIPLVTQISLERITETAPPWY